MGSRFFSKRMNWKMKSRGKRSRPKTFKSEEAVKAYAERNSIAKFEVEQKGKKFVMVME